MSEVLVVDRAAAFGGDWPQGFVPLAGAEAAAFLAWAAGAARFAPRPLAEATPAWKQWIPYCVIRAVGRAPAPNCLPEGIFCVERSGAQSEARLHGRLSIGLGGHVEPADGPPAGRDGRAYFDAALGRELDEELDLRLPPGCRAEFLGLLNDDSTPVGRVHAGLVFRLDLPLPLAEARQAVAVREISKMRGSLGSLVEFRNLWQDQARFESWSQLLVRAGIALPMGDSAAAP